MFISIDQRRPNSKPLTLNTHVGGGLELSWSRWNGIQVELDTAVRERAGERDTIKPQKG